MNSAQASTVVGPSSPGTLVNTCGPCVLRVGSGVSDFTLSFEGFALPDGRRGVAEIRLLQRERPEWTQSFAVSDSAVILQSEEFFVGAMDVNFDGYSDLFLATSRGVANTYSDYWLFTPRDQEFGYLGNYPVFTIDSAQHRLKTYERGGNGGMVYAAKQYEFINGALTLIESEVQEATEQPGVYKRDVLRWTNGELRRVSSDLIRAPSP